MKIKVLIVDDHAIFAFSLASLLNAQPDIEVVGTANDGATAALLASRLAPDIILMDLLMPGFDGVKTTRRLRADGIRAKILFLTSLFCSDSLSRALESDVQGAVLKNDEPPELLKAIRKVARGERFVSDEIQRILINTPPVPELSPRQREVLDLLVQGKGNAEIANSLDIRLDTVKEHLMLIFDKLGVSSRAEAISLALSRHLLEF